MTEQYFFDLVKPDNVALTAETAGDIFDSDPEDTILQVRADDGNTYDVVAWGRDNQLPYELKEKVERNSVMSQDKFFNVLTCYSRGLEYMDAATSC